MRQLQDRWPHNAAACLREWILIGIGARLRAGKISLIRDRGSVRIVVRFQTPVVHEPCLGQVLNETNLLKYQEHDLVTDLCKARSHGGTMLAGLSQLETFRCHLVLLTRAVLAQLETREARGFPSTSCVNRVPHTRKRL